MILLVYNTFGRKMEEFKPLRDKEVRIYVCGPTVYDYIHIGNARAFIIADIVHRYLEYKGFKVKLVSNITDIDDKMIKRATEAKLSVQQLGEIFSDAYFEDIAKLNVKKPDLSPRATQHISEIIEAIEALIDKGYAYKTDGDIYFNTQKFKKYGKLSGNRAEALQMGARIEVNPKKLNPADFTLWKNQKKGEPGWFSPWGQGRPGWHIECSTMAVKYLGVPFDIHMGGKDLIFPHHENEIAQAEAGSRRLFARYWLHNEWLTVNGEKMSKSLGNFVTVRDALRMCEPQVLRFFLISAHYQNPIDFNNDNLKLAETNLDRLINAIRRFESITERTTNAVSEDELLSEIIKDKTRFEEAMDDNFNTPLAITAIYDIAKAINNYSENNSEIETSIKQNISQILRHLLDVLGIEIKVTKLSANQTDQVKNLMEVILRLREDMRKRKDWKTTDEIRNNLQKHGIIIEDTNKGPKWKTIT